ncbi:phage major capsid protein [Aminobacter aganoensis]|uniref:HK97 family phage major capsid protein/HK97 family phage prohead protease n=1 Tax=Aminobacter aganoensis TaxID=83264 RepID=A0A7X0KNZ2_9HYPH|nr:phage major capsid protein [Aminobacter aganoensis]MBB6357661.1 HK97 family phage major capsid protein/HK97 family phage prohead protease [Aminobacter aganoensis]
MTERLEIKAALTVDDTGEITGLAWPFGSPDRVGDVIEKGAFTAPTSVPMLFAHDQRDTIGVWDQITETAEGLTVKGRLLVDDVARAREVRAMIKAKAVTGLSIGFVTKSAKPRRNGRTITALDLHEISVVAVPCHPGAQITTIKAADGAAPVKENEMANEAVNELEAKADPVIEKKEFDALKARLDKIEAKANRPIAANNNHPAAENDNDERKAFRSYLRHGKDATELKALVVSNDARGGYLAPAEISSEFIRDLVEFSPMRALATVRQTAAPAVTLPKRIGRTNALWKGETQATTGSEPSFGQIELPVKEIGTLVDISNWLEEDAPAAEAEVRMSLAEDFGQKEDAAFVNGDGVLAPRGFMTADDIDVTLNGHAANLSADALISLMYAMPAGYRNRGTWAMSGTTLATIRKLKDGQGNYLWQPSYQAGQPETILGRPVVEMIDMPDIEADEFPIAFGDFATAYRIYDRLSGLSVFSNPYLLATEGLIRIHARHRVGGDVVQPKALRKLKMATS